MYDGTYDYPDYPDMKPDFTVDQRYHAYTEEDHAVWHDLFHRQRALLPGRACSEFVEAFEQLGLVADRIPRFEEFNKLIYNATRWKVVAVPGLIPGEAFFEHLANRRFPVTHWIRKREQMDYLQEPDVFHDFFGHVPLLLNPVFADYMQAYGQGGVKAMGLDALTYLGRLYWYTVEFGLIRNPEGLRIYGAGILSSKGESIFCLDSPSPNRLKFNLERIMQTDYIIDSYQQSYWVIDSFDELFDATRPDFTPYYRALANQPTYAPNQVLPTDGVLHHGTGERS